MTRESFIKNTAQVEKFAHDLPGETLPFDGIHEQQPVKTDLALLRRIPEVLETFEYSRIKPGRDRDFFPQGLADGLPVFYIHHLYAPKHYCPVKL
jgi:hypothetical protein